jgi:hypothetical protein
MGGAAADLTKDTGMKCLLAVLAMVAAGGAQAAPVCLQSYRIDHTDVPDDSTILFTMLDHSVYRAHIVNHCIGLRNDPRGFTYEPIPGSNEICENLLTIRLNSYGSFCMVGKIEKIKDRR